MLVGHGPGLLSAPGQVDNTRDELPATLREGIAILPGVGEPQLEASSMGLQRIGMPA